MTRESLTRTNTYLPYEVIVATAGHFCLCRQCCFGHVTVAAVLIKEGAAKKVSLWEAKPLRHVWGTQESFLHQWGIFLLVIGKLVQTLHELHVHPTYDCSVSQVRTWSDALSIQYFKTLLCADASHSLAPNIVSCVSPTSILDPKVLWGFSDLIDWFHSLLWLITLLFLHTGRENPKAVAGNWK